MPNAHTPGPWTFVQSGSGDFPTWNVRIGTRGLITLPATASMETMDADSRLIAAAPDLLAALQSALSDAKPTAHREYWRDGADGESSELVREETWPDWIAAARAAINKATGA